jgi:hypothetical protein
MDEYEPTEGCLRGDGFEARVAAFRYAYPDAVDDDDAEWVSGAVDVRLLGAFGFDARGELNFRATELETFQQELAALHKTLSGEAVLRHMEDEIELRVTLDHGRGTISGFVQQHVRGRLEFKEIRTDQSYLFDAVAGLGRIVEAFPPRASARQ